MFLQDSETIYYIVYFIMTIGALFYKFFYSLLLIDVIKRSTDLIGVLKVLSHNWKKLLKTGFLILIVIYCYSLIGLVVFRESYFKNEENLDIDDG